MTVRSDGSGRDEATARAEGPHSRPTPAARAPGRRTTSGLGWLVLPAGSVRSRILVVFVAATLLVVGALVVYVQHEGSVARSVLEDAERIRLHLGQEAGRLLARETLDPGLQKVLDRIEGSLTRVIGLSVRVGDQRARVGLALRIRELGLWHEPAVRRYVDKAVVVHQPEGDVPGSWFNPTRELVFGCERLDREPGQMVEESLRKDDVVLRGGRRLAGPLRVLGANWGGYYLELSDVQGPRGSVEDHAASRSLLLILLLLIPGLVLLFGFTWRLISRRLIAPVEELGRVAGSVARGDYSRRLEIPPERDEITRVMAVFNRMLMLVEEYRDEMEDRVQEAAREIERKNRELMLGQRLAATGTLASGIAHEINNPLGGMKNVVRRLEREDLTPEQRRRYLDVLAEGIERIEAIVRKVLAVSPRKVTPQPLDVAEVIGRSLDLVRHRARTKGVSLRCEMPGGLPRVLGESNEVGQIFLNLLINAVDACREGDGRVDVRARRDGDRVEVQIEDDGVGMEPELAERAFDMFFTTKEAGKGTGLGLATVHGLVRDHGGTLHLRTSPGAGSCFTVRLPVLGSGGEEGAGG